MECPAPADTATTQPSSRHSGDITEDGQKVEELEGQEVCSKIVPSRCDKEATPTNSQQSGGLKKDLDDDDSR